MYKTIAGNICYPTGSILENIKAIVDTTWVVGKMDICMRVWFLNTVDVIMDTLIANDTSCSTINIDKKTVDVNKVAGAVGNISVYPNPVSKALHVKLPADILPEEAMVRFYDVFGRLLYSGVAENKVMTIDISTFPSGSYFLNVIGGDGRKYVTKILKE